MPVPVDAVRRTLVTALCLTSLSCAIGAVATANDPAATPATDVAALPPAAPAAKPVVVVALGDAVPAGSACDCRNFVSTYADLVSRHTQRPTTVTNLARAGARTADLLGRLQQPEVRSAVRDATTVLLMIGAEDFHRPFRAVQRGAAPAATYRPVARRVQRNVEQAITEIRALHPGPVTIAVLDYWNVVADGRVALRDYGPAGVAAAASATSRANGALRAAARAGGATFVSSYATFKGADGHRDPTVLLTADGEHPNAAGHLLLAYILYAPLPTG